MSTSIVFIITHHKSYDHLGEEYPAESDLTERRGTVNFPHTVHWTFKS